MYVYVCVCVCVKRNWAGGAQPFCVAVFTHMFAHVSKLLFLSLSPEMSVELVRGEQVELYSKDVRE